MLYLPGPYTNSYPSSPSLFLINSAFCACPPELFNSTVLIFCSSLLHKSHYFIVMYSQSTNHLGLFGHLTGLDLALEGSGGGRKRLGETSVNRWDEWGLCERNTECEQQQQAWHRPTRVRGFKDLSSSWEHTGSTSIKAWFSKEKWSQTGWALQWWLSGGHLVERKDQSRHSDRRGQKTWVWLWRCTGKSEVQNQGGRSLELIPDTACRVVCWEWWVCLDNRVPQAEDMLKLLSDSRWKSLVSQTP